MRAPAPLVLRRHRSDLHAAERDRFQSDDVDRLAAAGRDGSVAVWRVCEADGGLRSEALLALQLRDAAGARA